MTTAFPSAAVLMQLTCRLSVRNLWLDLAWIPRLQNVEADALTNGDYSAFSMCNRVEVVWEQVPLEVMSEVLAEGKNFALEMERLKSNKRLAPKTSQRQKKRPKTAWEALL